jgi:hypothetical protein
MIISLISDKQKTKNAKPMKPQNGISLEWFLYWKILAKKWILICRRFFVLLVWSYQPSQNISHNKENSL